MDLSKFEYPKAEYVKAFKISDVIHIPNMDDYKLILLHSGMSGMLLAINIPTHKIKKMEKPLAGNYFVMHDDGREEILTETEFNLEYMSRQKP